jgi:hypothetical protein
MVHVIAASGLGVMYSCEWSGGGVLTLYCLVHVTAASGLGVMYPVSRERVDTSTPVRDRDDAMRKLDMSKTPASQARKVRNGT